jgi:hypothetical protein
MRTENRFVNELLHAAHLVQAGRLAELTVEEKLASALALNEPSLLGEFGYTLPQALDRIRMTWLRAVPGAAAVLAAEAARTT